MSDKYLYLTDYERMCLRSSVEEIHRAYPNLSQTQIEQDIKLMKAMDTAWEKARFRRFARRIKSLIYRF